MIDDQPADAEPVAALRGAGKVYDDGALACRRCATWTLRSGPASWS